MISHISTIPSGEVSDPMKHQISYTLAILMIFFAKCGHDRVIPPCIFPLILSPYDKHIVYSGDWILVMTLLVMTETKILDIGHDKH